jgi:cytochrome P450
VHWSRFKMKMICLPPHSKLFRRMFTHSITTTINSSTTPAAALLEKTPRLSSPRSQHNTMHSLAGPTNELLTTLHENHGGNQYALYNNLHSLFGDVMYQSKDEFGVDIVTLFHPRDIESVIRNEGPLPRGLGQALLPFSKFYEQHAPNGSNLGREQGEEWKRVRKVLAQFMMPPKQAQSYIPHLERVMQDCSSLLPQHANDMGNFVPLMTYEMIVSILLDRTANIVTGKANDLDTKFVKTSKTIFPLMARLMSPNEMPKFLAGTSTIYKEFEDNMLSIMAMGEEFIGEFEQRFIQAVEEKNLDASIMQSYFGKVRMHEPDALTNHQMNVNFSNLIFAGVDTTSNVMQWMLYHIAQNQQVQSKMREEYTNVLHGRTLSSVKDYKKLKYTKMVMKETYRITPPVFGSARFLPNDFDLKVESTGKTATIPAETMIRLHPLPFLTEYSKNITWKDADIFRPERWQKGDEESSVVSEVAQHPYLNIAPFGVGKRMCMGARLAQVEIHSMFSRILQDYYVKLADDSPVPIPTFNMGMISCDPSPKYVFEKR